VNECKNTTNDTFVVFEEGRSRRDHRNVMLEVDKPGGG
jgi:hypothetical protein